MKSKKQLGIYIHIPFCVRKCLYCDFLSQAYEEQTAKEYVRALLNEIQYTADELTGYEADTVFIGGGTPSVLPGGSITSIMDQLKKSYELSKNCEITMEVNPGTVTADRLLEYKAAGINRISFGLQSVHEDELKQLGRIHSYEVFLESFHLARKAGFQNINIDIMSGLPEQTIKKFQETLRRVAALNPEHISAYGLILEEGTPFFERYTQNDIDEETDRQMYELTGSFLNNHGYRRYEISNYAKKGYECRHNLKYWELEAYIGLGTGAASLIENTRFSNIRSTSSYVTGLLSHQNLSHIREQKLLLTKNEQIEEFMFLGLRKIEGVSAKCFEEKFSEKMEEIYQKEITELCIQGLLTKKILGGETYVALTKQGISLSNYVFVKFLLERE